MNCVLIAVLALVSLQVLVQGQTCSAPATMPAGYVIDTANGGCPASSTTTACKVICASGYSLASGTTAVSVTCATGGTFGFSGCVANKCNPPTAFPSGYAVNAGCGNASVAIPVADCSMKCAVGYVGTVAPACATNAGTFTYTGCTATAVCSAASFAGCGNSKVLKANPSQITCATTACTVAECCDTLYCGYAQPACPAGQSPLANAASTPTAGCAGTACTAAECCGASVNCTATFSCNAASNLTLRANPAAIRCVTTVCGQSECCVVKPLCSTYTCLGGLSFVSGYATKQCATYSCSALECCYSGAIANSVSLIAILVGFLMMMFSH